MRGNYGQGGTNSIVMRGTPTALNYALKYLTIMPPSNYVGDIRVVTVVNDNGYSGLGGELTTCSSDLIISVGDVADDAMILLNGSEIVDSEEVVDALEDVELVDIGFSINHVDVMLEVVTVTVVAVHGSLSAGIDSALTSRTVGEDVYVDGATVHDRMIDNNDNVVDDADIVVGGEFYGTSGVGITITGPLSYVNSKLASLRYLADENWWGNDILSVSVDDITRNVNINVNPVNDFPEVRLLSDVQSVYGNSSSEIDSAEFIVELTEDEPFYVDFVSVYDVDIDDVYKMTVDTDTTIEQFNKQTLEVELTVNDGAIVIGRNDGILVLVAEKTRVVFRGLLENVNSAL